MATNFRLFDTLLEPIFVLNKEQNIVYCNEAASIIVGISTRKLTRGSKFNEAIQLSERIDWLDNLPLITEPTPYKEINFSTNQGTKGKVQITAQPIQNFEGDNFWILFFRDVTLEERLQLKYRGELEQKESVIQDLEKARNELENYSKNLERMVQERTEQVMEMHRTQSALLDSLGQGFFIFDRAGKCLDVFSKACLEILEKSPVGLYFWEVLNYGQAQSNSIKKWLTTVFSNMLPFEDLAVLGPSEYIHSQNRKISLSYYPLLDSLGQINGVVVVASDITNLVAAQQEAATEKSRAKMIVTLVQNKQAISRSLYETAQQIETIKDQMKKLPPVKGFDEELCFRMLHTIKGTAGIFSYQQLQDSCHAAETILQEFKSFKDEVYGQKLSESCNEVIHAFQNFITEITSILGQQILNGNRMVEIDLSDLNALLSSLSQENNHQSLIEDITQKYLYKPIGTFLEPYFEVAKQTALELGKELSSIEVKNDSLKVWEEPYSSLFSTLIHIFRNAVDHGIESPETRRNAGKTPGGNLKVQFSIVESSKNENKTKQTSKYLQILIQDDGGGVNPETLRKKLTSQGNTVDQKSDWEIVQYIFASGLSTKTEVTNISGRGVGLDAVAAAAKELGGTVWADSVLGKGTVFTLQVPLLTPQLNIKYQLDNGSIHKASA